MANQWGIPEDVEKFVLIRDKTCVYCGVDFSITHVSRKTKPSWEHIINDIHLSSVDNIALCCTSCNASKGAKKLQEWLKSNYCLSKNINENTVAEVVQNVIRKSISKT
ncbi:HNH endonuclease [Leeuwenhoekiella palythoae]|uniref:HNH endonuclease n=1 Tax=Leeuwenhoekiella palythoae TaxID=573501 RepID=A0A1M5VIF5_9FLAO|nr:HNH endonuclease domain-containing protein [Leeuwenhoekiella palythoae]RXG30923.1 HNH endonuclease [Leeuwenhoekiella palythoae]SHH74864.1 HNH endonuclease [Leeuwenhoekiella palythoae]